MVALAARIVSTTVPFGELFLFPRTEGVLPSGLVHKPFAAIASIICLAFIGSFDAASTCAAASSAPVLRAALVKQRD
jgi:hypothetical protein